MKLKTELNRSYDSLKWVVYDPKDGDLYGRFRTHDDADLFRQVKMELVKSRIAARREKTTNVDERSEP